MIYTEDPVRHLAHGGYTMVVHVLGSFCPFFFFLSSLQAAQWESRNRWRIRAEGGWLSREH